MINNECQARLGFYIALRILVRTFITYYLLLIGDKLSLYASCQAGKGEKLRVGLARFGRKDLTIPKSQFSGAVK